MEWPKVVNCVKTGEHYIEEKDCTARFATGAK